MTDANHVDLAKSAVAEAKRKMGGLHGTPDLLVALAQAEATIAVAQALTRLAYTAGAR